MLNFGELPCDPLQYYFYNFRVETVIPIGLLVTFAPISTVTVKL